MYRTIFLALIFLFNPLIAKSETYLVLSSTEASVSERIDLSDLREIFLGNRIYWRNGERIYSTHLSKGSGGMRLFLENILQMTPDQYSKYWRRRLFSGKGHPPQEYEQEKDFLEYLQNTKGAVGIVENLPPKPVKNLYFFRPSGDGKTLENIHYN